MDFDFASICYDESDLDDWCDHVMNFAYAMNFVYATSFSYGFAYAIYVDVFEVVLMKLFL